MSLSNSESESELVSNSPDFPLRDRSRSPIARNLANQPSSTPEQPHSENSLNTFSQSIINGNRHNISNNSSLTMAEFKSEYLQIVPDFTGNQALLTEFITCSESILTQFYNQQNVNDFRNIFILKSIKNKIKGNAAQAIASYNISTWNDLKNALLATYSDKRDLQTLIIELCNLRQGSRKALDFFTEIQNNLNLQVSYINMHNNDAGVIATLIENSQKLALRVFLKHLNGQLGDYLSTRNPDSLNSALHILTNDFNINDKNSEKFQPPNFQQLIKTNVNRQLQQINSQHANRPQHFNKYPQIQQANNQAQNRQNSHAFRSNPNFKPTYKPTPMSISTRNTYQGKPHDFRHPQNYQNLNMLHDTDNQQTCENFEDNIFPSIIMQDPIQIEEISDDQFFDNESTQDHFLGQPASEQT